MNLIEYAGVALLLVVARVGAFVGTFPLFRSTTVPPLIKITVTLALSIMWLSSFAIDGQAPLPHAIDSHWAAYGVAIAREVLIGGLLGFLLGLFFIPGQLAGAYLGQELGFNMAGVTDPTTDASSNVFGDFLGAISMLTFLAVDAHHLAIGAIYQSFHSFPVGEPLPAFRLELLSQSFSDAHRWGMELAAPLGTGLILIAVLTLLMLKISPQLNLFTIGIPGRFILGLAAAIYAIPTMIRMLGNLYQSQLQFLTDLGL